MPDSTNSSTSFPDPDDPRKPDAPSDLDKRSWLGVLKRTVTEFKADNCTDWAAALTYYGVLAVFPAAIALLSIIGLVGDPKKTTDQLLQIVDTLGPSSAADTFAGPIEQIAVPAAGGRPRARHRARHRALVGLRLRRRLRPGGQRDLRGRGGPAVLQAAPAAAARDPGLRRAAGGGRALALVVTGPVTQAIGDAIGLGDAAVTAWDIAKWPVMALVVSFIFSLLYFAMPNVEQPKFKWFTIGGVVALVDVDRRLGAVRASTSRPSRRTARPTARSRPSSSPWSGSGSPTSRCSSVPSSTPSWSAAGSWRPA